MTTKNKKFNNITFLEFCSIIRGYTIFSNKGKQIFKYQLFYKGISPMELLNNHPKYKIQRKTN